MQTTTTTGGATIPAPAAPPGKAAAALGPAGTPLTVARPDGPVRGGIVVVQEAYGARHDLDAVVEMLASWGYLAAAPHLFHRVGDPVFDYDELDAAISALKGLRGAEIEADLRDVLAYLTGAGVDAEQIGMVGFCMGGSITLWAAAELPVAAAVTFYGGGITRSRWDGIPSGLESAANLRAPWLGLYGDLDPSIPPDQVEQLRSVLGTSGRAATIVRFAEAGHGFAMDPPAGRYEPEAAKEAWTRTSNWFDAHLR